MYAPAAPERSANRSLYGDGSASINRRALIIGATALSALPASGHARVASATDPVSRARTAMGGAALLRRVKAIGWSGSAKVFTAGQVNDLRVETRIEPFVRARSDSWLAGEDRSARRILMVEGHGAFAVIDGKQTQLAPIRAEYERQQFGIYGHMLLAGIAIAQGKGIASAKAGFPEALFTVTRSGMFATADYQVAAPDTPDSFREHFIFGGSVTDQGLRWPQRIAITRNGKAFYNLTIDELTLELSPA